MAVLTIYNYTSNMTEIVEPINIHQQDYMFIIFFLLTCFFAAMVTASYYYTAYYKQKRSREDHYRYVLKLVASSDLNENDFIIGRDAERLKNGTRWGIKGVEESKKTVKFKSNKGEN